MVRDKKLIMELLLNSQKFVFEKILSLGKIKRFEKLVDECGVLVLRDQFLDDMQLIKAGQHLGFLEKLLAQRVAI